MQTRLQSLHPQAALWDMPVGNPVALCDTQHAGKEIVTRPMSEYFANDCDVLLCAWRAGI